MENETKVFVNIIDEVRYITSDAVSKKQDKAKLNYPSLIEKIKASAIAGESICYISLKLMNEFDKRLLEKDGFTVSLVDIEHKYYENQLSQFNTNSPTKQWKIKW